MKRITTFLTRLLLISGLILPAMMNDTQPAMAATSSPIIFFNEIHYDNSGTDTGEAIEIAGPAGFDLTGWSIVLYNGSGGASYATSPLTGTLANTGNGLGVMTVTYPSNGIQNGAPDGLALVDAGNNVVQFLSYEGVLTATTGPALGMTSNDIGVSETGAEPAGLSLQLSGTGSAYADFTWTTAGASTFDAANTGQSYLPPVFFNEIHYDNTGTDSGEAIEVAGPAGFDLTGWSIVLYNGSGGASYGTSSLTGTLPNTANSFGFMTVNYPSNGIQNGAPDGLALVDASSAVIQFLSYEGTVTATSGPALGMTSIDIGVSEVGSEPAGLSLQLVGTGNVYADFAWSGPIGQTFGAANTGQTFSYLPPAGDAAPSVASTLPENNASGVALGATVDITFDEGVTTTGSSYTIDCSLSSSHAFVVSGGPTTYTLDPSSDFVDGDTCTVTVLAAQVSDQDSNDPPDTMSADYVFSFVTGDVCNLAYTHIYDIQGSGATTPIPGTVTTQGVVVGDYELPTGSGQLRGYYIQDLAGDSDPATSDGIFVYNGGTDTVSLGDLVRVTGTAAEYQDQTQIGSLTSVVNCGIGTVAPVDVTLPFASADIPERYEGMLVRLPQTLYVTEHFQLGRFGQVVVSSSARLQQPTNVVLPGAPALALQEANNLNRIIIDDDNNLQNPDPILFGRNGNPLSAANTLRGGDTATGIVGVMTYTWAGNSASGNAYRVRPVAALNGSVNFLEANPRPTSAPTVGGTLRVAGMNLLNYFNTFGASCTMGVGGAATDCRGADDAGEFDRQWPKTVAALIKTGADVIGVVEIENDGYAADSALQDLVNKLNNATDPGTYAFIDADTATGQVNALGTDAIKVGLIYKPASVTPVGQTAALNTVAFVTGGDSAERNRPSLAQAFESSTGGRFVVDVNHLKSKGSACDAPDAGDGQGNCNIVRSNAAQELAAWLASDPTGTGDSDVLILGDLNSYAKEDPIVLLENASYTNLIASLLGPDAYSYVFDGQWGYLDHALASASLVSQVAGVGDYHINADEPSVLDYNDDFKSAGQLVSLYAVDEYRVSDHDPVIVGLDLNAPPTDVSLSNTSVSENKPVGTLVGILSTSDPNTGDTFTYSFCGGTGDASFQITGSSLKTNAVFDYEAQSTYSVCIRATDNGSLTFSENFTITVTDVLETSKATFKSVARLDGWTLESTENSGKGGASYNGNTMLGSTWTIRLPDLTPSADLLAGDDIFNRQYRSILSFDTSSLPDNAVIVSVTVKLKKQGQVGTNPFNTHKELLVDIRKPYFGSGTALAPADFQASANRTSIGVFGKIPLNGWYKASLKTGAFPFINLNGSTQFRVRFQLDDNNDLGNDYLRFYSGNAIAAYRPVLIVEYYVP